ncbi:hypothetical protein PUN4_700049 [Paraburkholderia unamae]|nr:hypothetical protein PUN4_700049 [Paraburkholderia unamae]
MRVSLPSIRFNKEIENELLRVEFHRRIEVNLGLCKLTFRSVTILKPASLLGLPEKPRNWFSSASVFEIRMAAADGFSVADWGVSDATAWLQSVGWRWKRPLGPRASMTQGRLGSRVYDSLVLEHLADHSADRPFERLIARPGIRRCETIGDKSANC